MFGLPDALYPSGLHPNALHDHVSWCQHAHKAITFCFKAAPSVYPSYLSSFCSHGPPSYCCGSSCRSLPFRPSSLCHPSSYLTAPADTKRQHSASSLVVSLLHFSFVCLLPSTVLVHIVLRFLRFSIQMPPCSHSTTPRIT